MIGFVADGSSSTSVDVGVFVRGVVITVAMCDTSRPALVAWGQVRVMFSG